MLQMSSPSLWLIFSYSVLSFDEQEFLNFNVILFLCAYFLFDLCFCVFSSEVKDMLPYYFLKLLTFSYLIHVLDTPGINFYS